MKVVRNASALEITAFEQRTFNYMRQHEKLVTNRVAVDVQQKRYKAVINPKIAWLQTPLNDKTQSVI